MAKCGNDHSTWKPNFGTRHIKVFLLRLTEMIETGEMAINAEGLLCMHKRIDCVHWLLHPADQ